MLFLDLLTLILIWLKLQIERIINLSDRRRWLVQVNFDIAFLYDVAGEGTLVVCHLGVLHVIEIVDGWLFGVADLESGGFGRSWVVRIHI